MRAVSIKEAKTHLSMLVEQAARGEAFIITKGGKPLAKVVPLNAPVPTQMRSMGFLAGEILVPDDFDRMGGELIDQQFGGSD